MKLKDKRRSSRMRKFFSLSISYHSVEHDDECCDDDDEDLLQEQSPQPLVLPLAYSTKPSSPENTELVSKEGDECPSMPDRFFDLIDGRNFDFASVPIEENDPFTTETAPIVAGGSNISSDGLTRQAQLNKKRQHSLCEWPEDKTNEDLVEEAWQESDTEAMGDESSPSKAPTPEYVVSGTIELKTVDQPSGITFQKPDHICPLKIQRFSPFSQFKTKTDLKPGMVVLQINGRDMTWESTKEAVMEIKKAKPGKVTITAIAPSKVMSAPKALFDKISAPPPINVEKDEKESLVKPNGDELLSGLESSKKEDYLAKTTEQDETTGISKSAVKYEDLAKTTEQDETTGISKSSVPTHYRDPSLMMIDSTIAETSADTISDVETSDGPSLKELNPSFSRVDDSAVTADTNGISSRQLPEKLKSHPLDSKLRMSSPKRTPVPLLGHMDEEVEMDVVYLSEDSWDEEDEKEPKTNNPRPTRSKLYRPKQSYKANITNPWEPHTKPPLPPKRVSSVPKSRQDPPATIRKPSVDEALSSAEGEKTQTNKSESESMDSEEDEEESQEGIFFLCDAFDAHISPMLATMKDFSSFANRITERMPSWMRVICHE